MKPITIRVLLATFVAIAASSASALDAIFFSQSNSNPVFESTITYNSLGSRTLYIWATDGTQVTPPVAAPYVPPTWPPSLPPTTAYFSYDLGVAGVLPSTISLTAGSIENPVILDASGNTFQRDTDWDGGLATPGHPTPAATVTRWNAASSFTSSDVSHVSPGAITGLTAVCLPVPTTGTGTPTAVDTNIHTGLSISPDNLYSGPQPGYSATAHAFLLGEVTFTLNSPGEAVLNVYPSTLNTSASSAIGYSYATGSSPNFATAYVDLSANYSQITGGTYATVAIDVVPEPATWSLLAVGAGTLVSFGRRRLVR